MAHKSIHIFTHKRWRFQMHAARFVWHCKLSKRYRSDWWHPRTACPPSVHDHIHRNRKHRYPMNVPVVRNAKLQITNAIARYPGSVHNSFIWNTKDYATGLLERHSYSVSIFKDLFVCMGTFHNKRIATLSSNSLISTDVPIIYNTQQVLDVVNRLQSSCVLLLPMDHDSGSRPNSCSSHIVCCWERIGGTLMYTPWKLTHSD